MNFRNPGHLLWLSSSSIMSVYYYCVHMVTWIYYFFTNTMSWWLLCLNNWKREVLSKNLFLGKMWEWFLHHFSLHSCVGMVFSLWPPLQPLGLVWEHINRSASTGRPAHGTKYTGYLKKCFGGLCTDLFHPVYHRFAQGKVFYAPRLSLSPSPSAALSHRRLRRHICHPPPPGCISRPRLCTVTCHRPHLPLPQGRP